jgi:hypothetical protein
MLHLQSDLLPLIGCEFSPHTFGYDWGFLPKRATKSLHMKQAKEWNKPRMAKAGFPKLTESIGGSINFTAHKNRLLSQRRMIQAVVNTPIPVHLTGVSRGYNLWSYRTRSPYGMAVHVTHDVMTKMEYHMTWGLRYLPRSLSQPNPWRGTTNNMWRGLRNLWRPPKISVTAPSMERYCKQHAERTQKSMTASQDLCHSPTHGVLERYSKQHEDSWIQVLVNHGVAHPTPGFLWAERSSLLYSVQHELHYKQVIHGVNLLLLTLENQAAQLAYLTLNLT